MSVYDELEKPQFQPSCDRHGHLGNPVSYWLAEVVVDNHKDGGCRGWFHIFQVPQGFEDLSIPKEPPYPQDF